MKKLVTFDDLRNAMARYAIAHNIKDWEATAENVIWFAAIQEAYDIRETYSIKDLARLIVSGMPAMTTEHVESWIATFYDDAPEEEWPDWEQDYFRVYFNVKKDDDDAEGPAFMN